MLVGMVLWEEVRRKRSQALIPSLCGILVYNDETSSVTSKELAGKLPMVRRKRPWLGLVTCLPESGRFQIND